MSGLRRLAEIEEEIRRRQRGWRVPLVRRRPAEDGNDEEKGEWNMLGIRKLLVRKHERGLLYRQGDFQRFLAPGAYWFIDPRKRVSVELYDVSVPAFRHRLVDFLVKSVPVEVAREFDIVETGADQVAVVYLNGRLESVIGPNERALFWKGIATVATRVIDIATTFVVERDIAKVLATEAKGRLSAAASTAVYCREVPEGHVGLLTVDGEVVDSLKPGVHTFWKFNRAIGVDLIDLRVRSLEVSGQEILTRDKVSLRINLVANYQFSDALKAVRSVKDPLDFLYKEIQFGLRAAVGTRTLDALLEDKGSIDNVVYEHVRSRFAEIGIDVRSIGVKDIILPGDMKEILGKVVEAEKVAQANVIRRREETNATRSLLNTAKVMEDNPTALRLKELETLEKVTEKIGTISVYGGLDGVLSELVRIKR
jgi:regulator of protease activity HflC (stomatin/prohibitin superfamily)